MEHSSPSRVSGRVYKDTTIGGQPFTLSQPLTVATFSEQEAIILARRLNLVPFALRAIAELPPNRHAAVWEGIGRAAQAGIVSEEEWATYERSLWKKAYMVWHCLDEKHKQGRTIAQATPQMDWLVNALDQMGLEEYAALMQDVALVSQDAAIKNSSGPSDLSGTQPTENPCSLDGQPFTTNSPSDSAGPEMR